MIQFNNSFKVNSYNCRVKVVVVNTTKEVSDYVKRLCKKLEMDYQIVDRAHGYAFSDGEHLLYIILALDTITINTVSHEIEHVKTFILDGDTDEENAANLSGFITEKVFKILRKNNINLV